MDMSSLIAVSSNDGESILPEVPELSEFHPDQLSSLVDIQEELEKLEANESVTQEKVKSDESVSMVDDVNVVDHEVTVIADQPSEEITILPEISDFVHGNADLNDKGSVEDSFNAIFEDSLGLSEMIPQNPSNVKDSNSIVQDKKNETVVHPSKFQLKMLKPYPDGIKGHTTLVSLAQPKKNIFTKVILGSKNQSTESVSPAYRLISQNNKTFLTNNTSPKAITLAQAKEMGKIQILPNQNVGGLKKVAKPTKTLTMGVKSPVKILPLPTTSQVQMVTPSTSINTLSSITGQKFFIRQPLKTGTILAGTSSTSEGQILQLPVSQNSLSSQIHQIQLPGKPVQYVRLVGSINTKNGQMSGSLESRVVATKSESIRPNTVLTLQRPVPVSMTTNLSNSSQIKMLNVTSSQALSNSNLQSKKSFEKVVVSPGANLLNTKTDVKTPSSNIVMVPAEFVKQYKPLPPNTTSSSPPSPTRLAGSSSVVAAAIPPPTLISQNKGVIRKEMVQAYKEVPTTVAQATLPTVPQIVPAVPLVNHKPKPPTEPNGIKPRKPCNCTKSQCLKLYCDCFANGEFCFQCNCNCCYNNLDHEEDRQRAIKACLERNPNAFRPKIGKGYVGDERRHNKGCNCKRSGCLKNYCECYEAKIPCSGNCKCVGCRNIEEIRDTNSITTLDASRKLQPIAVKSKLGLPLDSQTSFFKPSTFLMNQGNKLPSNLMTHEVVEATCQCLVAQVEGSQQLTDEVEKFILEEFGRCLVEIIECTTRTNVNTT